MPSKRIPSELEENLFSKALKERRRQKGKLLDLTCSLPTEAGLCLDDDFQELLRHGMELGRYNPHPRGSQAAREVLCHHVFSSRLSEASPENLFLTASTSEAYSALFRLLGDPGDALLIPKPSYPLISSLCQLDGMESRSYVFSYHDEWALDLDELSQNVDSGVKALVLVYPNNPTGHFLPREELKAVFELARKGGFPLIVDEVFASYLLEKDSQPFDILKEESGIPIFCLGGLSKHCGLPQMKLSWIYANGAAHKRFAGGLDWVLDQYLSVSTLAQGLLDDLLRLNPLQGLIQDRVRGNYAFLKDSLRHEAIRLIPAQAGWSAILRLPDFEEEESFAIHLIREYGLVFQPGYFFDLPFKASFVLSLISDPDELRSGIEILLQKIEEKLTS